MSLLQEVRELQIIDLSTKLNMANKTLQKQAIDIAQSKNRIAELETGYHEAVEMAIYDPLTGAVTQREMERNISMRIALLKRARQVAQGLNSNANDVEEFSILFFNLIGLQAVNKSFGLKAGNILLKTFGSALRAYFKRDTDVVCRWGGDEFVVLFSGSISLDKAEKVTQEFLGELSEISLDFSFENSPNSTTHKVPVSAVAGTSTTLNTPNSLLDFTELVTEAGSTMNSRK